MTPGVGSGLCILTITYRKQIKCYFVKFRLIQKTLRSSTCNVNKHLSNTIRYLRKKANVNEAQEKNKMHTELAGTDLKITVLSGFLEEIISTEIILSKIRVTN